MVNQGVRGRCHLICASLRNKNGACLQLLILECRRIFANLGDLSAFLEAGLVLGEAAASKEGGYTKNELMF